MQHDYIFRKKVCFNPTPRVEGVSVGKIFATMLLYMLCSLKFDIQHDHIPKKLNFGLGPTSPMSTQGIGSRA